MHFQYCNGYEFIFLEVFCSFFKDCNQQVELNRLTGMAVQQEVTAGNDNRSQRLNDEYKYKFGGSLFFIYQTDRHIVMPLRESQEPETSKQHAATPQVIYTVPIAD